MIPLLKRLADRGLLRIRSNKYACKRRTQIAFLVDPADLSKRLVDNPNVARKNGITPSENGITMERAAKMVSPPSQNGITMEQPLVRIREGTSEPCSFELGGRIDGRLELEPA
jgi:hypothetical protein